MELCHPGFKANVHQHQDGGIDGKGVLLHPAEGFEDRREVIVQCKAGKPTIDQVRDFASVISHTEGVIAGVFVTAEERVDGRDIWTPGMREWAAQLGTFKHEHSADEYERLQHWHIGQWWYKTPSKRFPRLPALADPLSGKEMTALRQTGFLMNRYGSG